MPRRLARRLCVLRKPAWVGARPGIRLRLGARAARRRLLGRGGRDWRVRRRSACDRGRRTRRCRSRCRGRRSSRRQPRRPDGRRAGAASSRSERSSSWRVAGSRAGGRRGPGGCRAGLRQACRTLARGGRLPSEARPRPAAPAGRASDRVRGSSTGLEAAGSSAMILRIDARISSMLGSPVTAALLMIHLVCLWSSGRGQRAPRAPS